MSEILTNITNNVQKDEILLDYLSLRVVDDGVLLTAKSKLIGDFIRSRAKGTFTMEEVFDPSFKGEYYRLSPRITAVAPVNHPSFFYLAPGGDAAANIFWIYKVGLDEGIKILFQEPIHIPTDLVTYTTTACERIKNFYLSCLLRYEISASMIKRTRCELEQSV